MTQDERNFRSAYYEKVGFRAVEEKKSLEILLKDKPLDKSKLRQFSLRFSVPPTYRNLVWKILLGVLPVYCDSHAFILSERKLEFLDLHHALQAMRVIDINQTPKAHQFLAMWLLQTCSLRFNVNLTVEVANASGFVSIIQTFGQFFEDDTDVYWLAKQFYETVNKFNCDYPKMTENAWSILEKEDHPLYSHLNNNRILQVLPVERWFDGCFAGILSENALGKIWDKLCGGCSKILVFVLVMLLMNQRHKLLNSKDSKTVINFLTNIPDDAAEVVANKSIEMWFQYGSPLTIRDKPKP